ncbi:MAG: HNH endonuclease [Pyrinomonadaceae bacterium]
MRRLSVPKVSAKSAYLTCISSVVQTGLKNRLEDATDSVVAASRDFDRAARSENLHEYEPQDIGGFSFNSNDLVRVYEERMVKKGSSGRWIYDEILSSPSNRRCPLCFHREVSTLDHHLDKASFPLLSVVPLNLVPACKDCNYAKLSFNPTHQEEQTIHPYYDDVNDAIWLSAKVIEEKPAAMEFYFQKPADWNVLKSNRVEHHFKLFNLRSLYSSNANNELQNIRYQYSQLLKSSGQEALGDVLRIAAESRERVALNSWQAATYRELSTNEWYLAGSAF